MTGAGQWLGGSATASGLFPMPALVVKNRTGEITVPLPPQFGAVKGGDWEMRQGISEGRSEQI